MLLKDRSQIVLVVVSIILLASNIFLIHQNVQLKRAVEQSKLFVTEAGYKFSELKVRGMDGSEENIDFLDSKFQTLLLIFNTSCDYCVQQYPYWKELVGNIDYGRWRVIAITSENDYDKIKKHLEEHKLSNIKTVTMPLEDMRKARLLYTPMTVAVYTDGEVKKVWAGLWKKKFELPN